MSIPFKPLAAAAALLACAACGTGGQPASQAADAAGAAAALAGTSWRLQEIGSMDDATGSTLPGAGRTYTVHFGVDGRAAFQLDCNRGTASYTSAATDAQGGRLGFGNVAMTRAMCPEGSLDNRVARDMALVRAYVLRGQTLTMSMTADSGLYVWTRDGAAAAAGPAR